MTVDEPQVGVSNKDPDTWMNVASQQGITGPVHELYTRFEDAGFPDDMLPEDDGQIRREVFPDQVVGRIAIRDELAGQLETLTGRSRPYSRGQQSNLMREGRVLERCTYPVQSIPAIDVNSLQAIAGELVETRKRRNWSLATDCRSVSSISSSVSGPPSG